MLLFSTFFGPFHISISENTTLKIKIFSSICTKPVTRRTVFSTLPILNGLHLLYIIWSATVNSKSTPQAQMLLQVLFYKFMKTFTFCYKKENTALLPAETCVLYGIRQIPCERCVLVPSRHRWVSSVRTWARMTHSGGTLEKAFTHRKWFTKIPRVIDV